MRRIDKKKNIEKANLMLEQRRLSEDDLTSKYTTLMDMYKKAGRDDKPRLKPQLEKAASALGIKLDLSEDKWGDRDELNVRKSRDGGDVGEDSADYRLDDKLQEDDFWTKDYNVAKDYADSDKSVNPRSEGESAFGEVIENYMKQHGDIDRATLRQAHDEFIIGVGRASKNYYETLFSHDDNNTQIDEAFDGVMSMEELIGLARKAGEIIPDAQSALNQLGVAYGNQIPMGKVVQMLANYDLDLDELNQEDEPPRNPDGMSVDQLADRGLVELDMDTYATQMDKTADYAWTTFLSKDKDAHSNPKEKGNKQGRVNKLSRDRFENGYYKQYPTKMTKINSNIGSLTFQGISWQANYTNYDLVFSVDNYESTNGYPRHFGIKYEHGSENNLYLTQRGVELDQESISKAQEMLKYTTMARTHNTES
tara:strand:+ start:116311 stop:117579 length:1269 start_codon:yes stop_codon:yes gene_type:complete